MKNASGSLQIQSDARSARPTADAIDQMARSRRADRASPVTREFSTVQFVACRRSYSIARRCTSALRKIDTEGRRNETRPCQRHHNGDVEEVIEMSVCQKDPVHLRCDMIHSIVDSRMFG
jgi:hypothetical protein